LHTVLARCAEILQSCIEEFEGLTAEWLDTLLLPLLPSAKTENPAAFKVAVATILLVLPHVQVPLKNLVHDVLVSAKSNFHGRSSDLADEIYTLIYELHKISPLTLTGVIPDLTLLLKVDQDEIRMKIVKLMGRLFSSESIDYTKEFPKDFKEFLGRLNDRSGEIRYEMVDICVSIMDKHPEHRQQMEGEYLLPPLDELFTNFICYFLLRILIKAYSRSR
jgi:hypothetical protein